MVPLKISVVINTYNRCHSLPLTLAGLERQTYSDFEVIVVNGPSHDETELVLEKFRSKIRVGTCPEACIGLSRNIGIEIAAGDVVAFVDDDGVPRDAWLETIASGYSNEAVSAVGGFVFDAKNRCIQWAVCTCTRDGNVLTDTPPPYARYQGKRSDPFLYFPGCNMSFRRSCLTAVGGFNEQISACYDDVEVCCRLHDAGYNFSMLSTATVDHRIERNSLRDDHRVHRDLYSFFRDCSIFVMQNREPPRSSEETISIVRRIAADWRSIAEGQLQNGVFTRPEFDRFCSRMEEGIIDGICVGSSPRPMSDFSPPVSKYFRQFKR